MEHGTYFFNIVLIFDTSHLKCSFKNIDHLPLFPRHVRPCPYRYISLVLFPAAYIFQQHGFAVLEGTSSLRLGASTDTWY